MSLFKIWMTHVHNNPEAQEFRAVDKEQTLSVLYFYADFAELNWASAS